MYTRKRRRKRKTKRGGLGPEVYVMAGVMTVLNGLMMTFGPSVGSSFGSYDNPCDKPSAALVDSLPIATPISKL